MHPYSTADVPPPAPMYGPPPPPPYLARVVDK